VFKIPCTSQVTVAFCWTLVVAHCGPIPIICGSCLCHEHITNSVIGVSRLPVLDCGTTFHTDYGGWDLPSPPSDNLWKLIYLATEALSGSFEFIAAIEISLAIYLSMYTADACMLSCCPGSDWSAHIQVAARCLPVQADSAAARVWSGSSPRRPTQVPYISVFCFLNSRVASMLDSSAVGPGFKSQPRRCWVTVLGKLFTPIVPLFSVHQAAKLVSSPLKGCEGNCRPGKSNGSLPPGLWLTSPAG